MSKILITGATGHLGTAVVEKLLALLPATDIRILARDEQKTTSLKQKGVEVKLGDYHHPDQLEAAMEGIEKLLLISSSDMNDRLGQHKNVVNAARKSGVRHIFYTGISMKNKEESPLKDFMEVHFRTEDYILESGLAYTFLRNGLYADVIPMFVGDKVLETGIFFPTGDSKVAFAVRKDLGEAAAILLAGAGHENKVYDLTGSSAVSFGEVATTFADLSGKQVAFVSPDFTTFESTLKQIGLPPEVIGVSLGFAAGIAHRDFEEAHTDLKEILGREETSLKDYLKEVYGL
jgi:NAD(P)H dehydrogenase (quinone)